MLLFIILVSLILKKDNIPNVLKEKKIKLYGTKCKDQRFMNIKSDKELFPIYSIPIFLQYANYLYVAVQDH